jgi:hypothetical protein
MKLPTAHSIGLFLYELALGTIVGHIVSISPPFVNVEAFLIGLGIPAVRSIAAIQAHLTAKVLLSLVVLLVVICPIFLIMGVNQNVILSLFAACLCVLIFTGNRVLIADRQLKRKALYLAAMISTIAVCYMLPTKQLDQKVGPFRYDRMALGQLEERLLKEQGIFVYTDDMEIRDRIMDFAVTSKISKRKVLEKLARETGLRLSIGYCGTGSTILFGSYPSFTALTPYQ